MRLRLVVFAALITSLPLTGCGSSSEDHSGHSSSTSAATTSSVAGAQQFEIYVADQTVPCQGMMPMNCLQVRRDPNAAWELHYDTIEGFDYQPGFTYQLLIEQRPWVDPPADAPSFTWHLVKVLSKQPA